MDYVVPHRGVWPGGRMSQAQPSMNDQARAVIRKTWQTGLYFGRDMEIGLELEVQPPGAAAYHVETRHIITLLTAAQFQPGQVLVVVVDPHNPKNLIITDVI